jgi:tRNA threonylcarbamoyladenosine biosynthesis protein TsaE
MEITTYSPQETQKLAVQLAAKLKKGDVVALYGDLGSGKTTFTGYLVSALKIPSRVQSPTFVISRYYKSPQLTVNHLDLYRLTTEEELVEIGISDILKDDSIKVIEWPELTEKFLPADTYRIYFAYVDEYARKITLPDLY